jgi:ABC-type transport system involved in multi-copper enzyme maturation permease subunit
MRVILLIALNTFREVVRQRLFLLILGLTVAAVAVMLVFPFFTFREDTAMFKDLSLSTAMLAMVFLVALTASSAVAEELDSKTATTVLVKPVPRWQFLLGKYVGVLLALAAATAVLAVVLFVTVYIRVYLDALPRERQLAFAFSQSVPAREFQNRMLNHALSMFPGSAMIFLQSGVLAAVAVVLSSRFSRVLAAIVTFGLFLAGHLLEFVHLAVRHSPGAVRTLVEWLVGLLPMLETFNITGRLSHAALDPSSAEFAEVWAYTALAAIYAAGYAALILLVGILLLRRREIT